MKNQANVKLKEGVQGKTTSDRAFTNHKEQVKSMGIGNGGGQRSDQTSNRDNTRKQENKKH